MTGTCQVFASKVLNFLLTAGPTPLPGSVYIGLSTSAPVVAAAVGSQITTEPTIGTGNYARVAIAQSTAVWSTASAGSITNGNAAIPFLQSNAAWSTGATTLGYWFLVDNATTGGTQGVIAYGTITVPQAVNASGITLSFATSQLTYSMA